MRVHSFLLLLIGFCSNNLISAEATVEKSENYYKIRQEITQKIDDFIKRDDFRGVIINSWSSDDASGRLPAIELAALMNDLNDTYFYKGYGLSLTPDCHGGAIGLDLISFDHFFTEGHEETTHHGFMALKPKFMEAAKNALNRCQQEDLDACEISYPTWAKELVSEKLVSLLQWKARKSLNGQTGQYEIQRDKIVKRQN